MSHLLARIMLAIIMLPLGAVVYTASVVVLMELVFGFSGQEQVFLWSGLITGAFVAVYWTVLWARTVRWTRVRVMLTLGVSVVALGTGAALAALTGSLGTLIGGILVIVLWLAMTVAVWVETRSERIARLRSFAGSDSVVCPRCGYNMAGLRSTVCPECGSAYTVQELIAGQRAAEQEELE